MKLGATFFPDIRYIGLCEPTFKKRFGTHKTSFNRRDYEHSTALSKEIWRIKDRNFVPSIKWNIVQQKKSYNPESGRCSVCQYEKYKIACYPVDNLLNKRTEIMAKCRHRRKFLLNQFGDDAKDA